MCIRAAVLTPAPASASSGLMADRGTRSMKRSTLSKKAVNSTASLALIVQRESSKLLDLHKQKGTLHSDAAEGRLVLVPPPSSQLDSKDKLWRLHSALLQSSSLMDRAIAVEDGEKTNDTTRQYERQREQVRQQLTRLLVRTADLLKTADGGAELIPSVELDGPSSFYHMKSWVHQVFKEVHHWSKVAVSTMQELLPEAADERVLGSSRHKL